MEDINDIDVDLEDIEKLIEEAKIKYPNNEKAQYKYLLGIKRKIESRNNSRR